jgi:2-C-methyl-D-erythritol 4-phosphate cytidylyltransferase
MQVFVILPAAGLGTRMSSAYTAAGASEAGRQPPKQFLELGGVPILIHTLRAFAEVASVAAIYVAVRASEQARLIALVAEHGLAGRVQVVEGGDTRQQSVANALRALPASIPVAGVEASEDTDDIILVHDAVRPLISPALIERTIEAVGRHGAAIVGLPATDTIKQVERTAKGALITATIPREHIVQAQTPQGFRASLLRRAFAEAEADGFCGTDEASLVERAGFPVAVVPGSLSNMKITQPGDLELAEFFLARAGKN